MTIKVIHTINHTINHLQNLYIDKYNEQIKDISTKTTCTIKQCGNLNEKLNTFFGNKIFFCTCSE